MYLTKNNYPCPVSDKATLFYHSHSDNNNNLQNHHSGPSSYTLHTPLQNQESNSANLEQRVAKELVPILKKILVVDDDPDVTLALKAVLENDGYAVDIYNDPVNVISKYKQPGMYDLLIIDVIMPKMDGFDLYERVKKIDDKVKACFITAYNVYSESLREIFPGFEVDCFMKKPIENEDLLRKVMNAII
ncbi:MAG TPA: response regulator [Nitrososphaeraceae archaeon]|nr:response regulator [Nitrososphaeraceae archaeon]